MPVIEGLLVDIDEVHISSINIGDAILHNGKIMTVSRTDILRSSFMGLSIFGDCYSIGNKLVKRCIIKNTNVNEVN